MEVTQEYNTMVDGTEKRERHIPMDWQCSTLIPVFKDMGDPLESGSHRAIKLLEHAMKIVGRVLEKKIRGQVMIYKMQCGLRPGKGSTDDIFYGQASAGKATSKEKEFVLYICRLDASPIPSLHRYWSHWWSQSQAWKWGGLRQEGHPA
jgi:hypothetical protein